MSESKAYALGLIDFIHTSPSKFHVAFNLASELKSKGFEELSFAETWDIKPLGKYFVRKNNSALVAFRVGSRGIEQGFKIVGAHNDAPCFQLKPNPEIKNGVHLKFNTEVYGGPIFSTWMDRPLSIAGRVCVKSDDPMKPEEKLFDVKKPIAVIPNLPIHFNREVNDGVKLNPQKDLQPFVRIVEEGFEKNNYLVNIIAKELGVKAEDILDYELNLYESEKGILVGFDEEFISSGKLDDLAMVWGGIQALIDAEDSESTKVMACFDNEEVGSQTKQGAASPMFKHILERIALSLNRARQDYLNSLEHSFLISADMVHAYHPNYPEKYDPEVYPVINGGVTLKVNARQSYSTDSQSGAVFKSLCQLAKIPYQVVVNRSDIRGGSTIGPIFSSQLDIRAFDMGTPMFAMHSIREHGGVQDQYDAYRLFKTYFSL